MNKTKKQNKTKINAKKINSYKSLTENCRKEDANFNNHPCFHAGSI